MEDISGRWPAEEFRDSQRLKDVRTSGGKNEDWRPAKGSLMAQGAGYSGDAAGQVRSVTERTASGSLIFHFRAVEFGAF